MIKYSSTGLMALAVVLALAAVVKADEKPLALVTEQDKEGNLVGWQFVSEQDDVKCRDVWQLTDGVLICR